MEAIKIQILNEQLEVLTQLSQLLERENELLSSKERNLQDIEPIIEEKKEIQQRLATIEDKRLQVMGDTTLAQFTETCGQDITELVDRYQSKMAHLSNLTEINKILIGIGVQYYEGILDSIFESTKEKVNTYGQGGQMYQSEIQTTSLFNKKA